jgi:hypothetical protein
MSLGDRSDPLDLLRRAEDVTPPAGARERVAALLLTGSSGAAVGLGALSSSAPSLGSSVAQRLLRRFAGWSLLPLAAGIVIGASGEGLPNFKRDRRDPPPPPQVLSVTSALLPSSSAGSASAPVAVDTTGPSAGTVAAPVPSSTSKSNGSAALAQERAVLDRARQKLASDEAGDALQLLEQHAHSYPNGKLTEEREAMMVNVLVSLGRTEQAKARGESFQTRFPKSLMLSSVKAALAANSAQ